MNTFLLEIGLEEVPAQMVLPSCDQLQQFAEKLLSDHKLNAQIAVFGTPRRFAVQLSGVPQQQADQTLEVKGPAAQMARDEQGNWTKAAEGFARKNGLAAEALEIREFEGREYLFARKQIPGRPVPDILTEALPDWVLGLRFPKSMRWGSHKLRFVRPIRWLLALWNDQPLSFELEMLQSGRETWGHRFLHPEPVRVAHAKEYVSTLEQRNVIASFAERKQRILEQIQAIEVERDFKVDVEPELLVEVTNLVEWPTALVGNFEEEFLALPSEVLVTSMAVHQRYFPVYTKGDTRKLLPHFVTVRNGDRHALETVQRGNERVIRARLSDARFFYQEDQKATFAHFHTKAAQVLFFPERGTLGQRVERIGALARSIAQKLDLSDRELATTSRIAELCKFDLQTQMVYEFPELQGVMGERYAGLKGEAEEVCRGIREHYLPRTAEDGLPEHRSTLPVALADKLDTVATAFSLNMIPTGAADPYALRRMAQGFMQLLLGAELPLSLSEITGEAVRVLVAQQALDIDQVKLSQNILEFLGQRQKFLMQEQEGLRYDLVNALSGGQLAPSEQLRLARELAPQLESVPFKAGVEAVVRALNLWHKNISTHAEGTLVEESLEEAAEQSLWHAIHKLPEDTVAIEKFLDELSRLEPIITRFFNEVMVMDADPVKQQNRLFLCRVISEWSLRYLDLRALVFTRG